MFFRLANREPVPHGNLIVSCPVPRTSMSENPNSDTHNQQLTAVEKHVPRMFWKSLLDAGASSFGKAFVLYALPMSVLRGQLKKAILKRASALAAFMGVAKAAQLFLFQQKNQTVRYYSQAIAGGLGASTALAIDSGLGYNTLVIWFAIRAARCLLEENLLGDFLNHIPFLPTAAMCLSAAQILSSWVRYPNELDRGYKKFLDSQGGRSRWVMERFLAPNAPVPYPLYIIRKPGTGYFSDAFQYFFAGLRRAGKVYIPLYVAALLYGVFQVRNHSPDRLTKLLINFGMNVARSSVFLSLYCTIAWASVPLNRLFFKHTYSVGSTRVGLRRHVWAAGLATLVERKERRPELAAYCSTYAIDSIWNRMENSNPFLKQVRPVLAAVVLIASCSILLHHYNKQPALVTKWVLGFETEEEIRKGKLLQDKLKEESRPINDMPLEA